MPQDKPLPFLPGRGTAHEPALHQAARYQVSCKTRFCPFCGKVRVDNLLDLLGESRTRQRLAIELLVERVEQRGGRIEAGDLTLRPWTRRLFLPVTT